MRRLVVAVVPALMGLMALAGCGGSDASFPAATKALRSEPPGQVGDFQVTLRPGVYKLAFRPYSHELASGASSGPEATCIQNPTGNYSPSGSDDYTITVAKAAVGATFYITYHGDAWVSAVTKVAQAPATVSCRPAHAASLSASPSTATSRQSAAPASFVCAPLSRLNAVTGLHFNLAHPDKDACLYDVVVNGGPTLGLAAEPLAPSPGLSTVAEWRASLQGTGLYHIRAAAAFFGSGAFWATTSTTCAVYGPAGQSAYDIQLSIDQSGGLDGHDEYAVVTAAAHLLLRR